MSISSKIALAMSADGASFEEVHNSLEKIADEFAIDFADWLKDKPRREFTKESLEIYKQEKFL